LTNVVLIHVHFKQDATIGSVERWLKKEGESFEAGETLCEVTIDGVTLGIDHKDSGVLAEILVATEEDVPVGKSLAILVDGVEDYEAFVAKFKKLDEESDNEKADNQESTGTTTTANPSQVSNITLIKTVKKLIKTDVINEEDDFAHDLLSLCRQGNSELSETFDASYDGEEFNEETFEAAFFIQNARSIVAKHNMEEK
jgi:pyruvate/2-oxoglutarate dehydrogenase complex dihydrolipoamide acyltransferase (E2) component